MIVPVIMLCWANVGAHSVCVQLYVKTPPWKFRRFAVGVKFTVHGTFGVMTSHCVIPRKLTASPPMPCVWDSLRGVVQVMT